ncbi:MAG: BREX-2 system adenine-specific DNA-methyltransferase PglX [Polyangiales bacterium]
MARGNKGKDLSLAQALGQFLERALIPDLRARVEESPRVKAALDDALAREREAGRTADDPIAYRERTLEQIGAAWLLDCVFVRFLEDRGFLSHRRLAGEGAVDAQERFGAAFPGLAGNAREYLLAVFREVGNLPGARELLGAERDVARRLGPSAAVAGDLLRLLRETLPDGSLRWRFGHDDTRVLGDLYQDLSASVRERYALLQTPDFVESFILDRTLVPAVREFGLDGLRVLDPTCGSGHFVLGAFERLREMHAREAPASDPKDHANAALSHVYGVDLNPFAVAITRFRLLIAYLRASGITRLDKAPKDLDLHSRIVVADSLLYGGKNPTIVDFAKSNTLRKEFFGDVFTLDDPVAAAALFNPTKGFHAVVGNPPYIVCRDSKLRESYRARYPQSATGKYALAAPFTERFFELAVKGGGFVGLINSNSFMKREFGKGLIEKVLRDYTLTKVVDTSGAYIPGHGTPTVILFGRHQTPLAETVPVVMGRRGEPETPDDPAQGKVWSSIAAHDDDERGFENEFITVAKLPRATLLKHPWSLGGGGASDLKELIEKQCARKLGEISESIGISCFTLEDDVYLSDRGTLARQGVEREFRRDMVIGEAIRDWSIDEVPEALFPYSASLDPTTTLDSFALRFLWPCRTNIANAMLFGGKTKTQGGLKWFEYGRLTTDKLKTPLSIAFAFVATHNHFVIGRGGKVFNRTAPIIKLPASATEDDHLALLAWLNSSAACFWMKQVFYPKASGVNDISIEKGRAEANRYEFAGTGLLALPVPILISSEDSRTTTLLNLCRSIDHLAEARANSAASCVLDRWAERATNDLNSTFSEAEQEGDRAFRAMVVLQEEIDWLCYSMLGLCDAVTIVRGEGSPSDRPFSWSEDLGPTSLDPSIAAEWKRRRTLIAQSDSLRLLENPMFKRPWEGRRGVFGHGALTWDEQVLDACKTWLLDRAETVSRGESEPLQVSDIGRALVRDPKAQAVFEFVAPTLGDDPTTVLTELIERESVPFLASLRFTDAGMEKRAAWERTWDLQRREDAGERVGDIPVPPKYDQKDYREARYWSLRGKLDVPRERFISYPESTTDDAPSPLYGWAGWDHRQRAEALTALYHRRRDEDGWTGARLVPLLAGLDEVLPWLAQWHNTPEPGEDLGAATPTRPSSSRSCASRA